MNLKKFLYMYDAPYALTVINDNNLKPIAKGDVYTVLHDKKNAEIMQHRVVAFGFYDGELAVRVEIK